MFSEILKIIPSLDSGALSGMENALNSRFTRVAKKFGKGLLSAVGKGILGGGAAGIGAVLLDSMINPLKETNEAITRFLAQSDDLSTFAKQFNTTSGKLFKLQLLGEATGLDPQSLFFLMEKFQVALSEAEQDLTKQTAVRKYVPAPIEGKFDEKGNPVFPKVDIAESFFKFIQNLRQMPDEKKIMAEVEIFGERQMSKAADFIGTDLAGLLAKMKLRPSEEYTKKIDTAGDLHDLMDMQSAQRHERDVRLKGALINTSQVNAINDQALHDLRMENANIANYGERATLAKGAEKIQELLDGVLKEIQKLVVHGAHISEIVDKIPNLRGLKGLIPGNKE